MDNFLFVDDSSDCERRGCGSLVGERISGGTHEHSVPPRPKIPHFAWKGNLFL
jgi:hypothetical protein